MKKSIIKYIAVFIVAMQAFAQEQNIPVLNQYIADNPFLLSATYAGIGDAWQARVTGFEQWVGVKDAPNTQSFSIDGRIANRSGIGTVIFNDKNGFTSQKGVQISFAHHVTLSQYNKQYLSFGISYKFSQFNIDSSRFNRESSFVLNGDIKTTNNNFDVGVLYRLQSFFISANAINLLEKAINQFNPLEPQKLQSYYIVSGFTFDNLFKKLQYEPSVLYRNFSSDTRSTLDINFKVRKFFKDSYFWGGASLRNIIDQDLKPLSISPLIGLKKSKFYLAYGYQINLNEVFAAAQGGSHLITIGIDFAQKRSTCGCTY